MTTRFAVIGTNVITSHFLKGAMLVPEFELGAVYSRNSSTAEGFLRKVGHTDGVAIYTDLQALCDDQSINAVYIASPNSFHSSQAIALLNSGKHVLGEKPSASNLEELEKIVQAAKNNNRLYMEALLTTHVPNYTQLKLHLPRIGAPRKYIGQYCQYSSRYDRLKNGETPNTFLPEFSNGALLDIGIYPLYPLIDLWGLPESIQAQSVLLETGVDGSTDLSLNYGDKQAVVSCSKISNGHNITEIQGELGRIEICFVSTMANIKLHLNTGETEDLTLTQQDAIMCYELQHFIEKLNEGVIESEVNTWQLSRDVLFVMDTARRQVGLLYPADKQQEVQV